MKPILSRTCVFGLTLIAAGILKAGPITLFSDFGPGNAFNCCVGDPLGGGAANGNGGFTLAAPFTPSTTAYLSQIDVAVSVDVTGNKSPDLNAFLLSSSGNMPGAVLESFSLTGVATVQPSIISFTSRVHPLLLSGTQYYVALAPADLINSKDGFLFNTTGAVASPSKFLSIGSGPFAGNAGSIQPAFRVTGDTNPPAIPEPSTWLMSVSGLSALMLVAVRRARQASQNRLS